MATQSPENYAGFTIRETPRVFRDEWSNHANKAMDLNWSALMIGLDTSIDKKRGKKSPSPCKINANAFGLASFLEAGNDQGIIVERSVHSNNYVYKFHLNDSKSKRQVAVEVLSGGGGGNYLVDLIADEAPVNPKEDNESLAQRKMRMSINENKKAASYIVDERLVVNKKFGGQYEAKGIEYFFRMSSDGSSQVLCDANSYVDQETGELTVSDLEWKSIQPYEKRPIDNLKDAPYPIGWLSTNMPHDNSLQKMPAQRFIS